MTVMLKTAIIVGATMRGTYLVTKDEISAPIRYLLDDWAEGAPLYSFRERAQYLVNCHRCSSVWVAAVALALSTTKAGMAVLSVLAASQATMTAIELMEEK